MEALFVNLIKHRLPDDVEAFVCTSDNTAAAVALADRISGGRGQGCVLHQLSLCIKTDVFRDNENDVGKARRERSMSANYFEAIFVRVRKLVAFFTSHNLNGACLLYTSPSPRDRG